MVDRDVGSPLLEILDRVAALTHHLADEPVGGPRRLRGRVDEPRLHQAPLPKVAVAGPRVEPHDLELLAAQPPVLELSLRGLAAAGRGAGAPAATAPRARAPQRGRRGRASRCSWPLLSVP